ncbi:unnamed protein product [Plutella xylostella]|uniref:(diamondback moth) hypothetical protein n=1 Tax=Plutella xylostella TaxID=51655 RepID=A0A8S4DHD9_PLUXY|nr:unnamed protein product [Plutella xylostella]
MMMTAAQPSLVSIEATIPLFTGADPTYPAARWVEEINDNAEAFGWSPSQKLLMARRALTGVAGLWLRSENIFKSFDELQQALLKEFPDEVNPKEIHEMMSNRKKKSTESCYEYMLVMKELGKRGGFPDYVAIQYIVDGIVDYEIHKIMLYGVTTYPDLKEKLKIYEYIKRKMETSEKMRRQNRDRWYYSCREKNHVASECPNGQTIKYESTVATPSGTRGELPMDVSVMQEPEQPQSSGCRYKSVVSVKQHAVMIGVRMDDATYRSDHYSKKNEVTSMKRQCKPEVVNVVNKQVMENTKVKEAPIKVKSIKEENIDIQKVEEVCEKKIVEEEVENMVGKESCPGEFDKKEDGPRRRYIDNKKVFKGRCAEKDTQYQHVLMESEIPYEGIEKKIIVLRAKEKPIAKRVNESCNFAERIMKDAMTKDYHVLR